MNLFISFSGRKSGNCDTLAQSIKKPEDSLLFFRDLDVHPCSKCDYSCFQGQCKYRNDDLFSLFERMLHFDKVIFIVPIYCGNPCSLYFLLNERSQDYFMHADSYDEIVSRLYIIGIFGSQQESPDFLPCLSKWFAHTPYHNRVLGIQRHIYGQKMHDSILEIPGIQDLTQNFLKES